MHLLHSDQSTKIPYHLQSRPAESFTMGSNHPGGPVFIVYDLEASPCCRVCYMYILSGYIFKAIDSFHITITSL